MKTEKFPSSVNALNMERETELKADSLSNTSKSQNEISSENSSFKLLNDKILQTLKNENPEKFATFIHPTKGILFSRYINITSDDKFFSKKDFVKYAGKKTKFTWGYEDSTGDVLIYSIKDFLRRWVYQRDFLKSNFSFGYFDKNAELSGRVEEKYDGLPYTKNHIEATEEGYYHDFNTLLFVFEKYEGQFYLVGVINDEWRI